MKNLIKFELRKILTKRFAVISVAAVLLLSLILSFSTLHSMYAFDGNGAEETGKAAVEIDKQIALKYEGKLTDNKVQQMMSEFKPTQDLHGMNAKYIYQNALQSSVFSHFADIDGNWNGLSVADVFGDKEIKVGYVNGWLSTSQNMAKIFIVLSLVVLILSAVCKSQMIAFVISAAIHVIPIMLPISETSALYRIIVLMPLFYSQYISIMSVEQMHNGMLYAVWSIPVAIALVVIGSIISHKAFSKHQVR